jgi:TolB-like protein/Flp pilus assembly protein TadD
LLLAQGATVGQFFDELKRRNVFRVAVAYIVAGWLVMQVADVVLDGIEAPTWVMKVFLLVIALGFPLALVISWAYELTPEGIKKERDVDRTRSITPETGRKLNLITIGLIVAMLAFTAVDRLWLDHPPQEGAAASADLPGVSPNSIAVLAFDDLSPDGDQAYFAEGLSEELLNVLAQIPNLQVAGRTSSFAFRGQQKDLREIGELLNVAHILEGSVRKAGDRIRVTAQLVKASDGFHLYSETYDRDLDDVFAVQDEIASSISKALLTKIVGADVKEATTTDTEAYELYLMARPRIHSRDIFNLREADTMLDRALEIDPIYAPALAQKALVTHLMSDSMGAYGDIPVAQSMPVSRRFVEQALALDPGLAEAHAVNGLLLDDLDRFDEAIESLNRALEINPNLSDAGNWLASSLVAVGNRPAAQAVLEDIVERDPTYGPGFNNLVMAYVSRGETDRANAIIERVARIVGDNDDVHQAQGIIHVMAGASADAVRSLRQSYAFNPNSSVMQMWYGFALLGVADYETLAEVGLGEHRATAYAALGDYEKALDVLEKFDLEGSFPQRVLRDIGVFYGGQGESEAFLQYIFDHYASLDELLTRQSVSQGWGSGYLGELAYAYRQRGDEDTALMLIEEMRPALDEDRADGMVNWITLSNEAEYAALSGDPAGAVEFFNEAIDNGFRSIEMYDSAIFASMRDDQSYRATRQRLLGLVNAERASLGMPPYRPIAASDEQEDRPSFVN